MEFFLLRKHRPAKGLRQALGRGLRTVGGTLATGADVGKGGSDQPGRHPKGSLVVNPWLVRSGEKKSVVAVTDRG